MISSRPYIFLVLNLNSRSVYHLRALGELLSDETESDFLLPQFKKGHAFI